MPVHYRKYLLRQTQKIKDKEAEQMKKAQGKQTPTGNQGVPDSVRRAASQGKSATNKPPPPPSK